MSRSYSRNKKSEEEIKLYRFKNISSNSSALLVIKKTLKHEDIKLLLDCTKHVEENITKIKTEDYASASNKKTKNHFPV